MWYYIPLAQTCEKWLTFFGLDALAVVTVVAPGELVSSPMED